MSIFNLENAKWLIATLTLPAVLAFAANRYQQSQAERQINEARLRLYTELLSKREEADTGVRRGIFDKVLERYLTPGDQGLQAKLVALELLATNFHDSLDLSPLFWQIGRQVDREPEKKRPELTQQLTRIADRVKDRQISALELGSGYQGTASKQADLDLRPDALTNENRNPNIDADLSFPDPDPFPRREEGTLTRRFKVWITAHDAEKKRVWAIVHTRSNQGEEKDQQKWGFWLDTFDFPMANFTRVSRSERFALVLQDYEPPKKEKVDGDKVPKVKLIYFPSARVGAKDKPFIDDVVSDLIHERK